MPDIPFTIPAHGAAPLDRNVVPIPECKVRPALQGAAVVKVVDVPILGCPGVWLQCQKEAERWVSDCDGKLLADPMLINRRINAAYAYLWLTDRRFQWAGLAAFASKQVGCGLLHAAQTVAKVEARSLSRPGEDELDFPPSNMADLGAGVATEFMGKQLALGNLTLFLDIYPLHRFYTLRGIEGIRRCLQERDQIKNMVVWPDEAKKKLDFGKPFEEIRQGFEHIDAMQIEKSVQRLAYHEQINILQKVIYDNPYTRVALDGNQFAWVTHLPTVDYTEIQLTLSAQCSPKSGWTEWFGKSLAVHLWNADDRIEFVYRAAKSFNQLLLGKEYARMESSINAIYLGGGVS